MKPFLALSLFISMGVRIKGLDHLLAKVKKLEQVLQAEVDAEMGASARVIEGEARQTATANSFDRGRLAGSIVADDTVPFRKRVTANIYYAPFVEFGTGKKVKVPTGLEAYAAGFRKKMDRGKFKDFVRAIEQWMKRVGIEAATEITQVKSGKRKGQFRKVGGADQRLAQYALAYTIARSILRNGLKARPFLFPAFFKEEKNLVDRIEKLIKDAT